MLYKIYLRSGCHKLKIKPEKFLYEFIVMSLWLNNVPATFISLINGLFKTFLNSFGIVFICDILFYSESKEEHADHLRIILGVLGNKGCMLNILSVILVEFYCIFKAWCCQNKG